MVKKNDAIERINKHVGSKIYALRLEKDLSRKQLSKVIGVSDQQLKKYENGENRIPVGILVLIAEALGENVTYFYKKFEIYRNNEKLDTRHQRMCIEVSRNFMKIENAQHQDAVSILIKSLIKAK